MDRQGKERCDLEFLNSKQIAGAEQLIIASGQFLSMAIRICLVKWVYAIADTAITQHASISHLVDALLV